MSGRPVVYITRKEHFSSCHRLHSVHLSEEENKEVFGKCNWMNGHGHNYEVKATVRGPVSIFVVFKYYSQEGVLRWVNFKVSRENGMVLNLVDLKKALQLIIEEFDHRNIDKDIETFRNGLPSTAENICYYFFQRLQQQLPNAQIFEVRIKETNNNVAYYRGEIEQ